MLEAYQWPLDSIQQMGDHLSQSGWVVREEEIGIVTGSPSYPNEKPKDPPVTYQAEIMFDAESWVVEVLVVTIFNPGFKQSITPELLHSLHQRCRIPGNLTLDNDVPEGSIVFTRIDHILVGTPRRATTLEGSIFRLFKRIEGFMGNSMNMGMWVARMLAEEAYQATISQAVDLSAVEMQGSA